MSDAGLPPDPWQRAVLESRDPRQLLLCTRQAGKSTVSGALVARTAMLEPDSLILILSPTERQSGELFRDKVLPYFERTGWPVRARRRTELTLTLANGSRVVSLPENERGVRCYSGVALLVIDEASRVDDALYRTVRPMLAVSRGRLVALSTPFGRRGWFFEEWESRRPWERFRVTALECPRHDPAFLAEERLALGQRWYDQEYMCSFEANLDQVFSQDDIDAAICPSVPPLFGGSR